MTTYPFNSNLRMGVNHENSVLNTVTGGSYFSSMCRPSYLHLMVLIYKYFAPHTKNFGPFFWNIFLKHFSETFSGTFYEDIILKYGIKCTRDEKKSAVVSLYR